MVIPSLIKRAVDGENPLNVWGDGTVVRDFIHATDCARGMIKVFEKGITDPINLASGKGITIREIVDTLALLIEPIPKIVWDTSKPSGDLKRVLDTSRAESYGIFPEKSLSDGLKETVVWYKKNKDYNKKRYNSFTEYREK